MHRLPLLALPLCAALACSDSTPSDGANDTAGGEVPSSPSEPAAAAPVAVPAGILGSARLGPLDATLEVLAPFGLTPEVMRDARTELVRGMLAEGELETLAVGSGGCDTVMYVSDENDLSFVSACDGPSFAVARQRLGSRAVTRDDGSLLVAPADGDSNPRTCSVEPTPTVGKSRIVCADDAASLEATRAYLGRNFEAPVAAGSYRAVLEGEAVRARFGADMRAGLAFVTAGLDSGLEESGVEILRGAAVREAVATLARDVLDDVSALVDEFTRLEFVAQVRGDAIALDVDLGLRNPSGSITRPVVELLRPTNPPTELVDRLPPGGFAYSASHVDASQLDTLVGELRNALSEIIRAGVQLGRADTDAIDRALASTLRATRYESVTAQGMDPSGAAWVVGRYRFASADEARAMVDGLRSLVSTVRRPAVARAIDARLAELDEEGRPQLRVGMVTDVRPRGFPAGSFAVRFPSPQRAAQRAAQALTDTPSVAPPLPENAEIGMMVEGSDVLVYFGTSVERLHRELGAGGVDTAIRAALVEPGYAFTSAYRLGNVRIPDEPHDDDAGAPTFESLVGVEAGRAVITFHVRNAGTAEDAQLEADVVIPGALVRGAVQRALAE